MHGGKGGAHPIDTTVGTMSTETWQNQSSFVSAPSMYGAPSFHSSAPSMHGGPQMHGAPYMHSMPSMQNAPSAIGSMPEATHVSSCYGAPSTVASGHMQPAPVHHLAQAPPVPVNSGYVLLLRQVVLLRVLCRFVNSCIKCGRLAHFLHSKSRYSSNVLLSV